MNKNNQILLEVLQLSEKMAELADLGDQARQDVGCGVLFGQLRDSAFKIRKLARQEMEAHGRRGTATRGKQSSKG